MPRTVVPPPRKQTETAPALERGTESGEQGNGDSIPEKLVKYVPAETLAFFVPAAAALGDDRDGWLIAVLLLACVGSVGYLWVTSPPKDDPAEKPLPHFYVLSVVAFVCWSITTSPSVADLLGIDDTIAAIILLAAVFLIPLIDSGFNRLNGREAPAPAT